MKQKQFVVLLSITFVWVVCWIGFDLYNDATTSTISNDLQQQVIPLDNTFDQDTIQKIMQRQQVTPIYEISGTVDNNTNPTTSPSPSSSSLIKNITTQIRTTPSGSSSSQTAPAVPTNTGGLP